VALALLAAFYVPDRIEAEPGPPAPQSTILFQDVRIFDGKSGSLSAPSNVLVRGNKIDKISTGPISIDNIANVTTIDGRGHTLMPGLIDAHWHAMLVGPNPVEALASDIGYLNLLAGAEATATLMRGFTTIRDMGAPVFGLKRAIDEGLLPGPRIYPSGAVITITGGHGDFRSLSDLPRRAGTLSRVEETGAAMIADSPDAHARATHARRIAN
jgi:imidazolonepropionase-like amidohydrolase